MADSIVTQPAGIGGAKSGGSGQMFQAVAFVRGQDFHSFGTEDSHSPGQNVQAFQKSVRHQREESVQFKFAVGGGHGHGYIVSHHAHRALDHHLGDDRV